MIVIPAKAGICVCLANKIKTEIPAFAGMTILLTQLLFIFSYSGVSLNNSHEVGCLQAGAPNQRAVDIGNAHQFDGVGAFD